MPQRKKKPAAASPTRDEWGIYDPDESGLPAVLGRLDAKGRASAAAYAARIARTLREARRGPATDPKPSK